MKAFFSTIFILLLSTFFLGVQNTANSEGPIAAQYNYDISCLVVVFTNTSTGAIAYIWDFGDGSDPITTESPIHTFPTSGTFTVTLNAFSSDGNVEAATKEISVDYCSGINLVTHNEDLQVYPNPISRTSVLHLQLAQSPKLGNYINCYDIRGNTVYSTNNLSQHLQIPLQNIAIGSYYIVLYNEQNQATAIRKIIIQ